MLMKKGKSSDRVAGVCRKSAFTLAEVLITLGIIGVVAAMTLPALKQKLDERANITMLKKFYSEFTNATNLLIVDYGFPSGWGLKDNDSASSDFVLNNGVTCFFDVNNGNFSVFFDVNGNKPPGTLGVDVFAWAVNGNGKIVRYTDPSINSGNDEADYNYAFEIMENSWTKKY